MDAHSAVGSAKKMSTGAADTYRLKLQTAAVANVTKNACLKENFARWLQNFQIVIPAIHRAVAPKSGLSTVRLEKANAAAVK